MRRLLRVWSARRSPGPSEPGSHFEGPLYRYPSLGEGIVVLAPVALGVARLAIDEFKRLALGKTPFMSAMPLSRRPTAQVALGKAEAVMSSARPARK